MRSVPHVLVISTVFLLRGMQAEAQQPPKSLPETKVVLRISQKFIQEVTGKEFKRDAPIDKFAFGAHVTGSIHVDGTFEVKLNKSDSAADFDVFVNGEALTETVATARSIQVYGHGAGAFTGRRRIAFDGNAFAGQTVEMNVTYHSSVDQLQSFRGGLTGALARGLARPKVRRTLPKADCQAENDIRIQLTTAIEKESDQLLVTINKVGPLLKKGEEILREQKVLTASSVQHYVAATEEHLYMSVGPPEHRIATLPRLDVAKRGPVELWIAIDKANRQDFVSPALEYWTFVRPFLLQRIKRDTPELSKIVEQVQVVSVDGWHVVTFAPKLLELP